MSDLGRACALGAAIVAIVTVAFWDSGSSRETTSRALDGAELFHAKGCATCHDGPDTTATIGGLPSLEAAGEWAGSRRPGMRATEYLTQSIDEPGAFISPAVPDGHGPAMPNLALSPHEIDALVDYLLSK